MMALNVLGTTQQCRYLRAKGMFIEVESYPTETTIPSMKTGFVWCVHSQNCLGPDGKVAGYESCVAGRNCYRA